jgi:hypothetical protein
MVREGAVGLGGVGMTPPGVRSGSRDGGVRGGSSNAILALTVVIGLLGHAAPCSPPSPPAVCAMGEGGGAGLSSRIRARDGGAGPRAGQGGSTVSLLGHMRASVSCTRGGATVRGAVGMALRTPPYLRGVGCEAGRQGSAEESAGLGGSRVASPWALRGAGEENAEHAEDGNQTKAVCNTDGGCPHGRHSEHIIKKYSL